MGIKEEITKIAVEQGYEGAKPKSIAQAIDALTDTLAGEDVKSGRSVVDAIRKYAPYVGDGGGGTTLGSMQRSMFFLAATPVVGETVTYSAPDVSDVYVGNQHVIGEGGYDYGFFATIASGARVTYVTGVEVPIGEVITTDDISINMYVVTTGDNEGGVLVFTSVTESEVEPSLAILHNDDGEDYSFYNILITLTQPELDADAGEILACYIEVTTGD